jgi:hypothetical protein
MPKNPGAPKNASTPRQPESSILQFKVTLRYTDPPIWRRLQVPASKKLSDLHRIMQVAMGWHDCHLHVFRDGKVEYGPSGGELGFKSESAVRLGAIFTRKGKKLEYEYDFGDGWMHQVVYEGAVEPVEGAKYPRCIEGARACPPEDCGSYPGYEHLCELMADPALPDPDGIREWLGGPYDPERFDAVAVNKRLKGR